MSSDISPSLVNWMTSMMTMRLQVILEHMPITQEQIQSYIVHTQVKEGLTSVARTASSHWADPSDVSGDQDRTSTHKLVLPGNP